MYAPKLVPCYPRCSKAPYDNGGVCDAFFVRIVRPFA